MTTSAGEGTGEAAKPVDVTGGIGVQVGDGTSQTNNYYINEAHFLPGAGVRLPVVDGVPDPLTADYAEPPEVGGPGASSPAHKENLTSRAAQENVQTARDETAGLREQADSAATPLDQLQALIDARDTQNIQHEDRIIKTLGEQVSAMTVARAMTVANQTGAFPGGEVTLRASIDPMIDLTFSWQHHIGDARFTEPSGNFLGLRAHVAADPGGPTPVIDTIWLMTERAETVIRRINAMLQQRDRWNGPKTINWGRSSGTCTGPLCSPSPTSATILQPTGSCTAAFVNYTARTGPSRRPVSSTAQSAKSSYPKLTSRSGPYTQAGPALRACRDGHPHRLLGQTLPSGSTSCGAASGISRCTVARPARILSGGPARHSHS